MPRGRLSALPLQQLIRFSGRSWWEVMLVGGRTIGEWQTTGGIELPIAHMQARSRWDQLDHSRIVAARLWCPDGSIGEVQATGAYRVFQFKAGHRTNTHPNTIVDAHVLGTLDGEVGVQGWEWTAQGLQQFSHPDIRALHLRYGQGPFSLDALGIRL